jgi:hypothetical protein
MAVIQPPDITQPPVAPQRKDRNTFAGRVDAFLTLILFVPQCLALANNIWNNAKEAFDAASRALAASDIAASAAKTATLTANVTLFAPDAVYSQGQSVCPR